MKNVLTALMITALPMAVYADTFEVIEEIAPESETNVEKAQARQEQRKALWSYLQESRVAGAERGRIEITLSEAKRAQLEGPGCEDCLFWEEKPFEQIGVHQALDLAIDLQQESLGKWGRGMERGIGDLAVTPEGEAVWTTSLQSAGASALRLRFTDFDLPNHTALFLYNDAGQAHGPYTGKGPGGAGDFWSHTVFGDHVWVQLHAFGEAPNFDSVTFGIATVSHLGPDFELPARIQAEKADCSANAPCVLNVNCYNDQPLSTARKAMALYVFERDGKSLGCSGGLLNDADGSDRTPWFLTADHCISTTATASSVEAFFQYQSSCGSCSGNYSDSVLGATLWAHGSDGDFSLLELSRLPSSWGLMGSTSANIRNSVGTTLNILSHPRGMPQGFSQHSVISPGNDTTSILSKNILGTIEKGSSGAPVFISGGVVVGLHSGANGTGAGDIDRCDSSTFDTRTGNLNYFWKSLRPYLSSPSGTYKMHVSEATAGTQTFNFIFSKLYLGKATIKVVDEIGNGVPRVTVTGSFSNGLSGTYSATTNEDGVATVINPMLRTSKPSFTFCVTNLGHSYFNTYDSAANAVTCASR